MLNKMMTIARFEGAPFEVAVPYAIDAMVPMDGCPMYFRQRPSDRWHPIRRIRATSKNIIITCPPEFKVAFETDRDVMLGNILDRLHRVMGDATRYAHVLDRVTKQSFAASADIEVMLTPEDGSKAIFRMAIDDGIGSTTSLLSARFASYGTLSHTMPIVTLRCDHIASDSDMDAIEDIIISEAYELGADGTPPKNGQAGTHGRQVFIGQLASSGAKAKMEIDERCALESKRRFDIMFAIRKLIASHECASTVMTTVSQLALGAH